MSDGSVGNDTATILLVEDDVLIALDLKLQIEALGYEVAGPFHSTETALASLDDQMPQAAILDFNLNRKETSKPIADRLDKASIPFVFLSGYAATDLLGKSGMEHVQVLSKPVTQLALEQAITEMVKAVSNS
jgi:two-component SAPR family response regulator